MDRQVPNLLHLKSGKNCNIFCLKRSYTIDKMKDINRQAIERVLAGDSEAFRVIVENHKRLVAHIVFRMVRRDADREDICQDVFVKVYRNLSGFKNESRLSTWIARIAHNTCLNFLEKKKPVLHGDLSPEENEGIETVASDGLDPAQLAQASDLSQRLSGEIAKLPAHFRSILTLYHLEEMTYSEISDLLQLPDGTVKSYLFRARRMLKKRLLARYSMEELCA